MAAAALLAAALLSLPIAAAVHYVPDWVPASDGAFIGLRAYDVGTSRTPLTGQPSFSMMYDGKAVAVDHPGPLHFYLLAPFVRLLGATAGLVVVTALTAGAAALVSTWVVFRLLGRRAAVIAAVVLGLVMFTNGAWAMASPVSSVYACYPVFCSAVLMWALLCGDDRLLPLAVGVASLAAQTHLASGQIVAVIVVGMAVGVLVTWHRAGVRHDAGRRRRCVRLGLGAVALGVALWSPVIVQQLFGRHPNLTALYEYSRDRDVETLGVRNGLWQVVHVMGWPPVLGRTQFYRAGSLLGRPDGTTWAMAAATVIALAVATTVWLRRPAWAGLPTAGSARHRRALLVAAAVVIGVAGFANGSRIPVGIEQYRLAFYHWIWPFTFFVATALALLVSDVAGRAVRVLPVARGAAPGTTRVVRRSAAAGAVATATVAIVVLAVADVTIDRLSNSLAALQATADGPAYEELARQIVARRDTFDGPTYLLTRNQTARGEHHSGLALQLEERGIRVTHPVDRTALVADARLVDVEDTASALVLVPHLRPRDPEASDVPGRLIASVDVQRGFDTANYRELVDTLRDGPALAFDTPRLLQEYAEEHGLSGDEVAGWMRAYSAPWRDGSIPGSLIDAEHIDTLIANPPTNRDLDMDALRRLRQDVAEADASGATCYAMDVYLVTGDELDELLHRGRYADDD